MVLSYWRQPPFPGGRFVLATVRGEVSRRYGRIEVDPELLRLIDPSSALRTVHWGNNYLYQALLRSPAGDIPVVVKAFRNETALQRMRKRWRGSKAERSWRASLAMLDAGIPIPDPIALVDSTEPSGPSFFITGHLDGALEARYLFRESRSRVCQSRRPARSYPAPRNRLGWAPMANSCMRRTMTSSTSLISDQEMRASSASARTGWFMGSAPCR